MHLDDEPIPVAILVTPDTTASVAFGLYDLFCSTERDWSLCTTGTPTASPIRPFLVGREAGVMTVCNQASVTTQCSLDDATDFRVVCVPEVFVPRGESISGRHAAEARWLHQQYQSGAVIASACSGALLLGEAGLLAGQDATTHWAYCDALAQFYPGMRVHPKQTLVTSGDGQRLVMAGSGTAWTNLGLYLISRLVGVEAATRVARVNLIDWHDVAQTAYASLASAAQHQDALIADCQAWVALHYHAPAPVAAMLKRSGLSARTFGRR
ncbi:MAG: DJ-1/PfpI family protein, partial [Rhizobacter sp.]|nr:DJ-1/PfpI family protein [Rhizobacter sp.]